MRSENRVVIHRFSICGRNSSLNLLDSCWILQKVSVFLLITGFLLPDLRAQILMRCATVAPEGSKWAEMTRKVSEEIGRKTGIKIIWYFSGSAGDDNEIGKKLREGKLDCAVITGNGLTYLVPPMRVLELPLLLRNQDEADKMRKFTLPLFVKIAKNYGVRLVSLGDIGAIHIFSKTPLRKTKDLRGKRIWVWKGDFLSEFIAKVIQRDYGMVPFYIPIYDLSAYFQDIDIIYSSSYVLITLGWDRYVRYYISHPFTFAFIGFVIREEIFGKIDTQKQKEIEEILREFMEEVSQMNRRNNREAFEILRQKGIVSTSFQDINIWEGDFQQKIWNGLKDKLYPSWLLMEILTRLAEYRAKK